MARKQKKHRRERSRLGKLFQFLAIVAVIAAMTVGATVFFQVETIEVSGNQRYTQEEIVATTGIQIGDNLFRMNKFAIQDHVLEEMPYVESILIRRKLPSTITVAVEEWDAVAQIQPNLSWVAPEPELDKNGEPIPFPKATDQAWLISVGGKVLEEVADSPRIKVTGLTAMDTRAGVPVVVPEEEQARLEGLLNLLAELEVQQMLADVSAVELRSTNLVMEYLGRYDVKLPLNGDTTYQLQALLAAVEDRERDAGTDITGSFDLTQSFTVVYSPQRLG